MLNYQRVKDRFEPQIMINPKGLVERVPFRANVPTTLTGWEPEISMT